MSDFAQLKKHFEGQRVVRVEEPDARECIAKFVMDNGKAFRLHATDLGYWIEATVASDVDFFPTLTSLFQHYADDIRKSGHEPYPSNPKDMPAWERRGIEAIEKQDALLKRATISQTTTVLIVKSSPRAREYRMLLENLTPQERKILDDKKGYKLLCQAAGLGDWWQSMFARNSGCPKELVIGHT